LGAFLRDRRANHSPVSPSTKKSQSHGELITDGGITRIKKGIVARCIDANGLECQHNTSEILASALILRKRIRVHNHEPG
jgi:phosphoribosyl 1,2-cyclic phosphodiesterase